MSRTSLGSGVGDDSSSSSSSSDILTRSSSELSSSSSSDDSESESSASWSNSSSSSAAGAASSSDSTLIKLDSAEPLRRRLFVFFFFCLSGDFADAKLPRVKCFRVMVSPVFGGTPLFAPPLCPPMEGKRIFFGRPSFFPPVVKWAVITLSSMCCISMMRTMPAWPATAIKHGCSLGFELVKRRRCNAASRSQNSRTPGLTASAVPMTVVKSKLTVSSLNSSLTLASLRPVTRQISTQFINER